MADIGDGLGAYGLSDPEHGRKKGDHFRIERICFMGIYPQCQADEKKEKHGGHQVNGQVDHMVSKGIQPAEIIVESKADIGQIPVPGQPLNRRCLDTLICQLGHMNRRVLKDKTNIIESKISTK